jgi:hypothetical protein
MAKKRKKDVTVRDLVEALEEVEESIENIKRWAKQLDPETIIPPPKIYCPLVGGNCT